MATKRWGLAELRVGQAVLVHDELDISKARKAASWTKRKHAGMDFSVRRITKKDSAAVAAIVRTK